MINIILENKKYIKAPEKLSDVDMSYSERYPDKNTEPVRYELQKYKERSGESQLSKEQFGRDSKFFGTSPDRADQLNKLRKEQPNNDSNYMNQFSKHKDKLKTDEDIKNIKTTTTDNLTNRTANKMLNNNTVFDKRELKPVKDLTLKDHLNRFIANKSRKTSDFLNDPDNKDLIRNSTIGASLAGAAGLGALAYKKLKKK